MFSAIFDEVNYLPGWTRPTGSRDRNSTALYALTMRLTWPLTGRTRELRLIEAALSDPRSSGVVICGPPGVGKTRIARAALDAAAMRDTEIRWIVATSSARGFPLGAVASWAEPAGTDSLQIVCGVIHALTDAPAGTAIAIGVDDAQLLDDLSMFVLQQIAQRQAAKLVLTVRDGDPIPPGVHELLKLGEFSWLELRALSREETATLLAATLAGPLDPETAGRLWGLTRGNILYLRLIVEQGVADGRLGMRDGLWHWSGDPVVPHGLIEVIEFRIGALPPAVAAVVDVLAIGEPIELTALRHLTDPNAVEEADIRGLIHLDDNDGNVGVRLAHPLYGEIRRSRAPLTRLRRLRGLLAAELAVADHGDDLRVLVRRAALSLDSDVEPDADLLTRAAQGAIGLADLPLAARLAEAAGRAGGVPEAQFLRAHALSWLGDGHAAEEVLAGVATGRLCDDDVARLTYLRASNLLWALGEPEGAAEIIEGATHLTTGAAGRCIDAIRTVYLFATDRPAAAAASAQDLLLDELPPIVGAETAWALANISGDAGRAVEAVTMAEAGYAIAMRCSDAPHMRLNLADAHVGVLLLSGDISGALAVAERERRQAADLPGAAHLLGIAVAGRAALGAGRLEVAGVALEQAARALSAAGYAIGWGYRYFVSHATALAMRGQSAAATEVLDALGELRRPFRSLDYEVSLARAWIAAGQGAVSEAVAVLRAAANTAAVDGRHASEVICLQAATQFGDRSCEPRLRELRSVVEGPRVGLAVGFAAALHDDDAAGLAAVSVALEHMGDGVAAADAASHAAIAYRRAELRGSALACATRAQALAARCGVDTPALRQVRAPLPLTDREREVVTLLGEGLSNRAIADRLVVSIRTVEGHVYKAMTKTGTTSRDELAALLSPRSRH